MPGFSIPNILDAEDQSQAQIDSRDFSDILALAFNSTGIVSGCAVTAQATPDMTVAVASGVVVTAGIQAAVAGGNLTIGAASGSSRFDLICIDAAGTKSVVAGTPSASPVFPNPSGKIVLAAVRVPAGASSINAAKIVDKRVICTIAAVQNSDVFNIQVFGALPDGTTDNATAINNALTAGTGKTVYVPPGVWKHNATLAVPAQTSLQLAIGATLLCNVTGGGNGITLGADAQLIGMGRGSQTGYIRAAATANVAALITNVNHTLQEYAYVDGLYITANAGAVIGTLIDFTALHVNSSLKRCTVDSAAVADRGLILRGGATVGFGPILIEDVWFSGAKLDNVFITETTPFNNYTCEAWFSHCTFENWGSGYAGVKIVGYGGIINPTFRDCKIEYTAFTGGGTYGIDVQQATGLRVDCLSLFAGNGANKVGIRLSGAGESRALITNVHNTNNSFPVTLEDNWGGELIVNDIGLYVGQSYGVARVYFKEQVQATAGFGIKTKAGIPADADYPSAPPIGTQQLDTTNSRMYTKTLSVEGWKYAALL